MKKMKLLVSILVLSAMLLAACAGGGDTGGQQTPGAGTTPGAGMGTGTPAGSDGGAGAVGTGTVEADAAGTGIPNTGSEGAVTGTGTPEAGDTGASDALSTPTEGAGGAAAEGTATQDSNASGAGTAGGQAGAAGERQFALLSDVLKMSVTSQDGDQLGTVQGVVINSSIPVTGTGTGTDDTGAADAAGTPEAGGAGTGGDAGTGSGTAVDTTETPAAGGTDSGAGTGTGSGTGAGTGTDTTGGAMVQANAPDIAYVLINVTGQAGTPGDTGTNNNGANTGGTTGGTDAQQTGTPEAGISSGQGAVDATTTPAAGEAGGTGTGTGGNGSTMSGQGGAVAVPWEAFAMDETNTQAMGTLTLNLDSSVLAGAPGFSQEMAQSGQQDPALEEYWASQGMGIPATGGDTEQQMAGQQIVVRGNVGTMNVTGMGGGNIGQVRDFVVDLQTGELVYAVLSGQGAGSQFYAVPMDNLTWEAGKGQGGGQGNAMGSFTSSFDAATLQGAPSAGSVDEFDWTDTSELDTYWQAQNSNK